MVRIDFLKKKKKSETVWRKREREGIFFGEPGGRCSFRQIERGLLLLLHRRRFLSFLPSPSPPPSQHHRGCLTCTRVQTSLSPSPSLPYPTAFIALYRGKKKRGESKKKKKLMQTRRGGAMNPPPEKGRWPRSRRRGGRNAFFLRGRGGR